MDNSSDDKLIMNNITSIDKTNGPTSDDYDLARYIYFYGLAIILPVGLVCNILCFGVFLSSKSMRMTTTGHYLIALAVADSVFLIGELSRWMNSFDSKGQILGIDFMETILFWCRFTFYFRYAGKLASAWITVVISVERFITVAYPLKVARISTPIIAKLSIAAIFIACFALGAYPFWTIGLILTKANSTYCGLTDPPAYEIWSMVILRVGSLFLPSAIIFFFTIFLVICLKRATKRRKQLEEKTHQKSNVMCKMDFQLTTMLISVAIAFLVLRLPYTVTYYINMHKAELFKPIDKWHSYKIYLVNKIFDMIAISNYAINFFLYCLVGSSFRKRLCVFISCQKGGRYLMTTSRTLSSKISMSTTRSRSPTMASNFNAQGSRHHAK